MMSAPVALDLDYSQSELPEFEKRNVRSDLSKVWLEKILLPCDAVVFDFIDERFGLGKRRDSMLCYSTAYRSVAGKDSLANCDRFIRPMSEEYSSIVAANLPRFCEVLGVIPHLIVNDAKWAAKKENGDLFAPDWDRKIEASNRLLDGIFEAVAKSTKATFLGIPEHDLVGKIGHRWGDAPFHYSDACEQMIADRLIAATRREKG